VTWLIFSQWLVTNWRCRLWVGLAMRRHVSSYFRPLAADNSEIGSRRRACSERPEIDNDEKMRDVEWPERVTGPGRPSSVGAIHIGRNGGFAGGCVSRDPTCCRGAIVPHCELSGRRAVAAECRRQTATPHGSGSSRRFHCYDNCRWNTLITQRISTDS